MNGNAINNYKINSKFKNQNNFQNHLILNINSIINNQF